MTVPKQLIISSESLDQTKSYSCRHQSQQVPVPNVHCAITFVMCGSGEKAEIIARRIAKYAGVKAEAPDAESAGDLPSIRLSSWCPTAWDWAVHHHLQVPILSRLHDERGGQETI